MCVYIYAYIYIYACIYICMLQLQLPRWLSGKESACQYRRHRFDPWVRKIPWKSKWQLTPVFLPGKFHGGGAWWATVHGVAKCWTQLSDWAQCMYLLHAFIFNFKSLEVYLAYYKLHVIKVYNFIIFDYVHTNETKTIFNIILFISELFHIALLCSPPCPPCLQTITSILSDTVDCFCIFWNFM